MVVNRPFNRINTIILWNIIKPTKSLQFIGMWKQFVAGRHSTVVTIRQFRNELHVFEKNNGYGLNPCDPNKIEPFYRLPSVHFEDFSENIIPAYIKDI